jgi:hypothetical protein
VGDVLDDDADPAQELAEATLFEPEYRDDALGLVLAARVLVQQDRPAPASTSA